MRRHHHHTTSECALVLTPAGVLFGIDSRDTAVITAYLETLVSADTCVYECKYHEDLGEPEPDVIAFKLVDKLPTIQDIKDAINAEFYHYTGTRYVSPDWRNGDHRPPYREPIELRPADGASCGDFDRLDKYDTVTLDCYIMPDHMSGSDYSGNAVEVSNKKAFMEEYQNDESMVIDVYGGHGTYAVAIRLDSITFDILDTLAGLEDYPLMDEETHSEVEYEAENEAWDNWVRSDFNRDLVKQLAAEPRYDVEQYTIGPDLFDFASLQYRSGKITYDRAMALIQSTNRYQVLDLEAPTVTGRSEILASAFKSSADARAWMEANTAEPNWVEDKVDALLDSIDDNLLFGYFCKLANDANEYWINEEGNNAHIDYEKFIGNVSIEDLERLAKETAWTRQG